MKTYEFINVSNKQMTTISKLSREANKEYSSLGAVLRDMSRQAYLNLGYMAAFEALGVELEKDVKHRLPQLMSLLCKEQFGVTMPKKGGQERTWIGLWGWRQKKDENGVKMFEADGVTPIVEPVLREVKSWSPTKVFRLISQANAIRAQREK